MPGVPSSRGCDTCRAQKKKCDLTKPSCSRCIRLKVECVGAGLIRYQFRNKSASSESSGGADKAIVANTAITTFFTVLPSTGTLEISFIETIKPTTRLEFNLGSSFGDFLDGVPARIGHSKALEAAVRALVDAHESILVSKSLTASVKALKSYSSALATLRSSLNDSDEAKKVETLCAVMILIMCQSLHGQNENQWTGHSEGASLILKARGFHNLQDPFERRLLASLRGPILVERLFNKNISLDHEQWKPLVEVDVEPGTESVEMMMKAVAHAPSYRSRIKKYTIDGEYDFALEFELSTQYDALNTARIELDVTRSALEAQLALVPDSSDLLTLYVNVERFYGLMVFAALIYNLFLDALRDNQDEALRAGRAEFEACLKNTVDVMGRYGPLVALSQPCYILGAAVASDDPADIAKLVEKLLSNTSRAQQYDAEAAMKSFKDLKRQLIMD